ncbi:PTS sugar transporter subunit IIA [Pectobacterium punjabense]|uniref:PTS sugar transporter subunit IIA n=1 Tax=Pectobacterium punjabense TaxID=2108399 RepID=UPI00380DBD45
MNELKEKLIKYNCIKVIDSVDDWEEAIKMVAAPLLEKKFIEQRYVDEIISETKKIGGYYVYDDEAIALPHARPECGALKNGASLLLLKTPIAINGSTPVSLILMFCAIDAREHIESGLKNIMEMLENETKMESIRNARSVEELINVL